MDFSVFFFLFLKTTTHKTHKLKGTTRYLLTVYTGLPWYLATFVGSGHILSKADWYMYHRKYQAKPERQRPSIKPLSLFSGQPKLIAFFRDELTRHIYRSESDNDGVKWSRPTKTTLPNNDSGIQVTMSIAP